MARRVLLESSDEERFAAHVIRKHHLGRPIERILEDPYLRNRLVEGARQRLVERPDVIRAVAADTAAALRQARSRAGAQRTRRESPPGR